jgi:replicative DNA helicase
MNMLHDSTNAAHRVPPHSIEAEEYLLACCFLDGSDVVARCIEADLTPRSFYSPANGVIFEVCISLFTVGQPFDLSTIAAELETRRQLSEIGGYAYLTQISSRIPTTAQSKYFIAKVRELHALRETIKVARGLVESCYAYEGEGVADLVTPAVSRLTVIASGGSTEKEKDWDAVVSEAEVDLQAMLDSKGKNARREIPFPWPRMNELFGPMQRGQLVVIAARASVGKSSLARPMLRAATDIGRKAYYVTLEVNPRRVPLQIASSIAGIGLRQVAHAHAADQRDVMDALRNLKGRGITISSKDRSIARIEARARALHAKGMLDIMFIDHGGYVQDVYKVQSSEKVGACGLLTKTLKRLADELDIVVVLLWQLNRSSVQQGNREPNLTDLKDSGSLEEDADKVLLIHRPDADPLSGNSPQSETMSMEELPRYFQNVIQAKGRDDGTAFMSFYLRRATATFSPASGPE